MNIIHNIIVSIVMIVACCAVVTSGCMRRAEYSIDDFVSYLQSNDITLKYIDKRKVKSTSQMPNIIAYIKNETITEPVPEMGAASLMEEKMNFGFKELPRSKSGILDMKTYSIASLPVTVIEFKNERLAKRHCRDMQEYFDVLGRQIQAEAEMLLWFEPYMVQQIEAGLEDFTPESCAYKGNLEIIIQHALIKERGENTIISYNARNPNVIVGVKSLLEIFNEYVTH